MNGIEFLLLALLGFTAGSWGALIGTGGGFIIVPMLLLADGSLSTSTVTAISLIAVFFNGVSGTTAYARLGRIDYRSGFLFLIATLPGSIIGALLVNKIDKGIFQLIFGGLLCVLAMYMFLRPVGKGNPRHQTSYPTRRIVDRHGTIYEYQVNTRLGFALTSGVGFLASMLGVGGGIFNVPAFIFLLGMPIQVATATSQLMIVGTAFVASVTNVVEGDLTGFWAMAVPLTIGSLVGAQIGARLSQVVHGLWITRALTAGLLVVGLRLVVNAVASS